MKCGKSVTMDCTTRWNSTLAMIQRLIELKTAVNDIVMAHGIDLLVASEWAKLTEVAVLLEPFAVHTDVLQTDTLSLSNVLPVLMDLKCHLEQWQSNESLTGVNTNL